MSLKVCVIEPDQDIRTSLQELLQREGHRVLLFSEFSTCLNKLREETFTPEIILCAENFNGSGRDFCRSLKNVPYLSEIPFYFMCSQELMPSELKTLGAQGSLKKPFSYDEVSAILNLLLKPS